MIYRPGTYTEFRMPLANAGCPGGIYWSTWIEPDDIPTPVGYADVVEREAYRRVGPVERRLMTVSASDWEYV